MISGPGFSLLEVMLAMAVLVIGLLSVLGLLAQSIVTMELVQEDFIARQKSREALETIYTAHNTQQITFEMIENQPEGIFVDGFEALRLPNPSSGAGDGLVGTADDGEIEALNLPGPDGQLGTADDVVRPLTNFEREIRIEPVSDAEGTPNPDLRKITVTVRYSTTQGLQRSFQVLTYISRKR